MNKFLFSVLFILSGSLIFAQSGYVEGKITDSSGEPLFNVNIIVDASKGWATVSDFDGNYKLSLPAGRHNLTFKYIGKEDLIKQVLINEGKSEVLNVVLQGRDVQLGPIVIGASKRGKAIENEVVSVEVLTSEFLTNNNITNGAEAIDRISGITILDGQASIRGGSGYAYGAGSRVILVIDEMPLLSPERSEVLWDFIPMEDLQQLEVVKGASSVQYGSSALNGIVNVTTKWPTQKKETEISVFHAFYDRAPIREGQWWRYLRGNYRENPHDMGIIYNHRRKLNDEMDFTVGGTLQSNQTHIREQHLHRIRNTMKWRYRPEKVEGLNVGVNSNVYYRNQNVFFIWDGFGEGSYTGESYQDKYLRMMIDPYVKYFFKDNSSIKSLNRVYYDNRIGSEYYSVSIYNDLQYQRIFKSAKKEIEGGFTGGLVNTHNIIKAVSFRESSVTGDAVFGFNNFATYAQSDVTFKNLTLAGGARFDWITIDNKTQSSKPVFNTGLNYRFLNENFVRASFGQSFRVPALAERFVDESISDNPAILVGPNPEIRPESGYSVEVGYRKIVRLKNWRISPDIAFFWQDFEDMVEFVFGFWEHPYFNDSIYLGFSSQNIADAKIFGWEINVNGEGKIGNVALTFMVGYTYNYAANAAEDERLNSFGNVFVNSFRAFRIRDEDHLSFIPGITQDNVLNGMLRYRFRHTLKFDIGADIQKFTLGLNVRYYSYIDRVDEIFKVFIPGIDSYRSGKDFKGDWVFDTRVLYNINSNWTVGLIVKNLFNRDYQIRPARPDAPRTFTVQARVRF
jgi:outer membrane receptor protein involved in Fe transport